VITVVSDSTINRWQFPILRNHVVHAKSVKRAFHVVRSPCSTIKCNFDPGGGYVKLLVAFSDRVESQQADDLEMTAPWRIARSELA